MFCNKCKKDIPAVTRGFEGNVYCPECWELLGNTLFDHLDVSEVRVTGCDCTVCQWLDAKEIMKSITASQAALDAADIKADITGLLKKYLSMSKIPTLEGFVSFAMRQSGGHINPTMFALAWEERK